MRRMCVLNKQGTVLYLIVLGVFVALGVLFLFSKYSSVGVEVKGEWPVAFLKQNYLPAQKELLLTDAVVKNAVSTLALDLATKGGFAEESPCGGKQWNKADSWCIPNVTRSFVSYISTTLQQKRPGITFSDIHYNGTIVRSQGEKKTIISDAGMYTYDTSFAVDVGYSLQEYALLEEVARKLVTSCRNTPNVVACVAVQKPTYWKFGSCVAEVVPSSSNKVINFCIASPLQTAVYSGDTLVQELQEVEYFFALDFSSTEAVPVGLEEAPLTLQNEELSFPLILGVDSYVIHYTNWLDAQNNVPGTVEQVFSTMPTAEDFGYFHKNITFSTLAAECPQQKQAGVRYICGSSVVYSVKGIEGSLFTVTSVKQEMESSITSFVQRE